MIVSISQSNYIPWKGYFDLIAQSDVFVLYDDMQYTKRDWRNRNQIKTPNGLQWLSIPVQVKGKYLQKINETRAVDNKWVDKHIQTISINYKKTPFWEKEKEWVLALYQEAKELKYLTDINSLFIKAICNYLNIKTTILDSRDYLIEGTKTEALLSILKQLPTTKKYLSGPAAKSYLDIDLLSSNGMEVKWMDYTNYPAYKQLHPPFNHYVSILDLLFNCGEESFRYIKNIDVHE